MSNRKRPYQHTKPNEEEALWEYVSGSMSSEQEHLLEADKVDDPFWNDAVEGLQQLEDKQKIRKMSLQLQQQARKEAGSRNSRKLNSRHQQQNILITVLILLLLLACYFFFHFMIRK